MERVWVHERQFSGEWRTRKASDGDKADRENNNQDRDGHIEEKIRRVLSERFANSGSLAREQRLQKEDLSTLFEGYHQLSYQKGLVLLERITLCLPAVCAVMPIDNREVTLSFCNFISLLARKYKCVFDTSSTERVVYVFLRLLSAVTTPEVLHASLRALGYVLFENGQRVGKFQEQLMKKLREISSVNNLDVTSRRLALNCLGNLTIKLAGKYPKEAEGLFETLYENVLKYTISVPLEIHYAKFMVTCLRCFHNVISECRTIDPSRITYLLASLRKLLFYGSQTVSSGPSLQFRSEFESDRRRDWIGASDSELSDTESIRGGGESGLSVESTKLRHYVLLCLQSTFRACPKLDYREWPIFLPADSTSLLIRPAQGSLLTLLLHDSSPKVRSAAANAIAALMDSSPLTEWRGRLEAVERKPVSSQVQQIDKESTSELAISPTAKSKRSSTAKTTAGSSFISLSQTLASIVREVHKGFLLSVDNESHPNVLAHILTSFAIIIAHTPYDKMGTGILVTVLPRLEKHINSTALAVRVGTLTCLAACFSTKQPLDEIRDWLTNDFRNRSEQSFIATLLNLSQSPISILPTTAAEAATVSADTGSLVRKGSARRLEDEDDMNQLVNRDASMEVETAVVITRIARNYAEPLRLYWTVLHPFIVNWVSSSQANSRLHAFKLIEEWMKSSNPESNDEDTVDVEPTSSLAATLPGWADPLLTHVLTRFNDESTAVRTAAASCFSYLKEADWTLFQNAPALQQRIIDISADTCPAVRAAACRTLGTLALHRSSRQNVVLLTSIAERTCELLVDSNLTVRIRAAWSVANMFYNDLDHLCSSLLNPELVHRVVESVIAACGDNDKVRSNAVRALGNQGRFVSYSILSAPCSQSLKSIHGESVTLLDAILQQLAHYIRHGTAKVRWNACFAIGNIYQSESIPSDHAGLYSREIIEPLLDVLTCSNFKIRIHAAQALCIPRIRSQYGNSFVLVWTHLLQALRDTVNVQDYAEYNYKDTLQDQLVGALVHVVNLTDLNRYEKDVESIIRENASVLLDYVSHYASRLARKRLLTVDQLPSSSTVQKDSSVSANEQLEQLRHACAVLASILDRDDRCVSFPVLERFRQLSRCELTQLLNGFTDVDPSLELAELPRRAANNEL